MSADRVLAGPVTDRVAGSPHARSVFNPVGAGWAMLLGAILGLAEPAAGASGDLVLGILEQPQCKDRPPVAVRALFAKRGSDWVALTSETLPQVFSLPDAWTVGLGGRSLGAMATTDPGFRSGDARTYPRDGLLLPTAGQTLPEVGNDEQLFGGWCDTPKRRPLVVVSRPAVADPDGWTRHRPAAALLVRLFEDFRRHAGVASTCPDDPDVTKALPYGLQDLNVFTSYRDRTGRMLVSVGLDPERYTCDGPPEAAWLTHSFLVDGEVIYLGAALTLVDAGDYDADGAAEVLFWFSGYNEDGYTLFYDGFRKQVEFRWKYH